MIVFGTMLAITLASEATLHLKKNRQKTPNSVGGV